MKEKQETVMRGVPAAPGIAIGQAYLYARQAPVVEERTIRDSEVEAEIERLHHAIAKAEKELSKILTFAEQKLGEAKARIFEAQVMILRDPYLNESFQKRIRSERKNAEHIVSTEIEKYRKLMLSATDEYMHERAHDVDDLKNRILRNMQEEKLVSRLEGSPIVVSHSLTAADAVILSRNETLGYATDMGGITSHASLISRSLKLPAVVGLGNATRLVATGDTVILDGYAGIFIIHPTREQIEEYRAKEQRFTQFEAKLAGLKDLPAKTLDDHTVELAANIEFADEIEYVQIQGAQGIGLYRTESLLMGRTELPTEEEQYENYRTVADRLYPGRVIARTFDVGGDKVVSDYIVEENPFLGWRGIRVSLDRPEVLLNQLRAMLRASVRKNLAIMFPMVTDIDEVRKARAYVKQAMADLEARHLRFDEKIRVGVMIEIPAAALTAGDIAREVDFLSIGTNDLIQYMLAVDRGNSAVSKLYREFHPAVLRTIKFIVDAGHRRGKWVGMCGEMAADPLATILLLGVGLDEFSVIPAILPEIKKVIRSVKFSDAQDVAREAMDLATEDEVEEFLMNAMKRMCPDIPLPGNNL